MLIIFSNGLRTSSGIEHGSVGGFTNAFTVSSLAEAASAAGSLGLVPRGKPQPTGGRMCADMCTGTTCSQTRFGHCAPDGRGIRTPCFRGSPAWAGRARPCRAAREAGGTRGLAETGSASAAGGVVVVLWRDTDCGTPPRGRRT
ncbi:hypothetical protein GCM10010317_055130 [Streptomyces mirabilis]|nr:hypothetical protein GCM10010317_055130 [Streptomyces mirabilis]